MEVCLGNGRFLQTNAAIRRKGHRAKSDLSSKDKFGGRGLLFPNKCDGNKGLVALPAKPKGEGAIGFNCFPALQAGYTGT